MDEIYNNVFDTLFNEFPLVYGRYYDGLREAPADVVLTNLREIRNYISLEVDKKDYKRVRPDAKLFLISNYYHMVLLPVLMYNGEQNKKYPLNDDFKNQVRKDVNLIMTAANRSANEEITSHSIIMAINETWKNLFTTVRMSWSNSDNY